MIIETCLHVRFTKSFDSWKKTKFKFKIIEKVESRNLELQNSSVCVNDDSDISKSCFWHLIFCPGIWTSLLPLKEEKYRKFFKVVQNYAELRITMSWKLYLILWYHKRVKLRWSLVSILYLFCYEIHKQYQLLKNFLKIS